MKKITSIIWFIFLTISPHYVFGAEASSSSKDVIVISSDEEEDDESKTRKDPSAPVSCVLLICTQKFRNETELSEHVTQCHGEESIDNVGRAPSAIKKPQSLRGPKPIKDLDNLSGVFYTCELCSLNFRKTDFENHLSAQHETSLDNYIAHIKSK